jgi:hypothetical protein
MQAEVIFQIVPGKQRIMEYEFIVEYLVSGPA